MQGILLRATARASVRRMTTAPRRSLSASARRLPPLRPLAQEIRKGKRGKDTVAESADWLVAQASSLRGWEDFEDLGVAAFDDPPNKEARALCHHMVVVRAEVARQLWSRHVFVGVSVLDDLIFRTTIAGASDPVLATLEQLRDSRLDLRSAIVFPLHSFGVLAAGLLRPIRDASTTVINPRRRLVLSPQTNNLATTTKLINDAGPQVGVKKPIDPYLIEHWYKSRKARWLEANPLLIAGVTSISGFYYENEFLLLGRVRALTTSIVMLATLQPRSDDRGAILFSSSSLNNFETRDIRHYLLLSDAPGKYLTGRAVPIHHRRKVDALSDLAVEVDPRFWGRHGDAQEEVYDAVDALYDGFLKNGVGAQKETTLGRTYRKLFDATDYFRKSHQGTDQDWSAVVSLATAFEMLLTDSYDRGVSDRLRRRTQTLLTGVSGTRRYQQAVVEVYEARSATVHRGEVTDLDLYEARKAFVLCFLAIMRRVPTLQPGETRPMGYLTGDTQ